MIKRFRIESEGGSREEVISELNEYQEKVQLVIDRLAVWEVMDDVTSPIRFPPHALPGDPGQRIVGYKGRRVVHNRGRESEAV